MTRLQPKEGDGRRRLDRRAADFSVSPVEAGGNVDRDDRATRAGEGVDGFDDRPRLAVDVARKARPEDGVDDSVRLGKIDACGGRASPANREAAIAASPRNASRRPRRPSSTAKPHSARRRATTKPSPPLLPGPQRTTIRPPDRTTRAASSATARPAASISTIPGVPPAIVDAVGLAHLGGGQELRQVHGSGMPARWRGPRPAASDKNDYASRQILLYRAPRRLVPDSSAGRAFDC